MIRRPPRSTRTDTLSLHDALPISRASGSPSGVRQKLAAEAAPTRATCSRGSIRPGGGRLARARARRRLLRLDAGRLALDRLLARLALLAAHRVQQQPRADRAGHGRSEEHTSELQSLMRISYAVFCLKKNKQNNNKQ